MTEKVTLKIFTDVFWDIGEVWVGKRLEAKVNRYYKVTEDWIYIYNSVGGHDTHERGELIRKISLKDREYERVETVRFDSAGDFTSMGWHG